MNRIAVFTLIIAACHAAPAQLDAPAPLDAPSLDVSSLQSWTVPEGWRPELLPFPLSFAPTLTHQGVEEVRFPPGVFDPSSTMYWSYVIAWRLVDVADLDDSGLSAELTTYYRGLMAAVDSNHVITAPDQIVANAHSGSGGFTLAVHIFDAFNQGQPVDLLGSATRVDCDGGSLWVFELSPATTSIAAQLAQVGADARCGQPPVQ